MPTTRKDPAGTPRRRWSDHITWHHSLVEHGQRSRLLGQTPYTLWMTGLSGAGKSTIAFQVERNLLDQGYAVFVLDGDNLRHGLNRDLGFSDGDRTENLRRAAEVAKLFNEAGMIVLTSFISPTERDRATARDIIGADRFIEVFVDTPLAVCEARDPKGLYALARSGKLAQFTGISAPYDMPVAPDIRVDANDSVLGAAEQIVKHLMQRMHGLRTAGTEYAGAAADASPDQS